MASPSTFTTGRNTHSSLATCFSGFILIGRVNSVCGTESILLMLWMLIVSSLKSRTAPVWFCADVFWSSTVISWSRALLFRPSYAASPWSRAFLFRPCLVLSWPCSVCLKAALWWPRPFLLRSCLFLLWLCDGEVLSWRRVCLLWIVLLWPQSKVPQTYFIIPDSTLGKTPSGSCFSSALLLL